MFSKNTTQIFQRDQSLFESHYEWYLWKNNSPIKIHYLYYMYWYFLLGDLTFPDPGQEETINLIFYFYIFLCASKGFIKALKTFIETFQAPQRSVKKKT